MTSYCHWMGGQCVPIVTRLVSGIWHGYNHSLLLLHLENSFGITGTVPQWFPFLSVRPISVRWNEWYKSSVRDLTVGVPQGSVLGPILYLLYIAPLAEIIQSHGLNYHFCMLMILSSIFTYCLKIVMSML